MRNQIQNFIFDNVSICEKDLLKSSNNNEKASEIFVVDVPIFKHPIFKWRKDIILSLWMLAQRHPRPVSSMDSKMGFLTALLSTKIGY